jgi:DNA (cytosine-5)-methyltransferase 1
MSFLKGTNDQVIPEDVPMSEESRNALSKKLNYWVDFKVLRAADFGKPQNRARVFIVGFDKDYYGPDTNFDELFSWPEPMGKDTKVDDILERDFIDSLTEENDKYTISDKLWLGHQKRKEQHKLKGNGFGCTVYKGNESYTNTLSARYYKDGSEILIDQNDKGKNPRKLTPRECANLQGFPKEFIVNAVSHGQIYKQFGNSVCVTVVDAVGQQIRKTMVEAEEVIAHKITKLEVA